MLSKTNRRKVSQGFFCMFGFRRKDVARFSPQTYLKNCLDPMPHPSRLVARSRCNVRRIARRSVFAADIPSVATSRRNVRRKVVARFRRKVRRNVSSQGLFASQEEFVCQ